ncbi:ornithine cyclodeaminase family protein [Vandammella animalimorsus]|uniref:Ornithine cyclodeaminase n=1 Tax=Vandammella animalimorsus TaxID=2029117 RepID=A0A2A2AIV4_9BURK|nr:ornithine cyclodeaminase family protein [Vandammella animalimorsus]PAT37756.1 ornithine cyclodeaminase [Vandammella animalimorsus]RMX15082.1 ornithine cyclodeaminase family protein [Vandammella animalimorsus]
MHIFTAEATAAALPFEQLVPALRAAFCGPITVPQRHIHPIGEPAQGTTLIMPAWDLQAGFMGIKIVNVFPANAQRGLPGLHANYLLYDAHTGVPLALMDGDVITARRTAAAAALGAAFLAREDAAHLLVLGAGRVASMLPAAFAAVRPIARVSVWNHRPEGAQRLAAQWREQGWDAQAVTELAQAVPAADIVSCATLSQAALVQPQWLAPGAHLDLIGSFTPAMQEAAPGCLAQARVFVDTDEALQKAGDLLRAIEAGVWRREALQGDLFQLCRGSCTGRASASERTVFKAVGNALEDLAAAQLVWAARPAATGA